jgi:hypothetical protein
MLDAKGLMHMLEKCKGRKSTVLAWSEVLELGHNTNPAGLHVE